MRYIRQHSMLKRLGRMWLICGPFTRSSSVRSGTGVSERWIDWLVTFFVKGARVKCS